MPSGFFRGLAKTLKDEYQKVAAEAEAMKAKPQSPPAQAQYQQWQPEQSQWQQPQYTQPQQYHTQQQQQYNQPQHQYAPPQSQYTQSQQQYTQPQQQYSQPQQQHFNQPQQQQYNQQPQQHNQQPQQYNQTPPQQQRFTPPQPQSQPQSPQPQQQQQYTQPQPQSPPHTKAEVSTEQPKATLASQSCPGALNAIPTGESYRTEAFPNFDICPSCYNTYVANSPFANHFQKFTSDPETRPITCDMAFRHIREAWADICTKTSKAPNQSEIYFSGFSQQTEQVSSQLTEIVTNIQALNGQIQVLQVQQNYLKRLGLMQIQSGFAMNCSASSNLSVTYVGPGLMPGEATQRQGNENFAAATRMGIEIAGKEMQRQQLLEQFKRLAE